MGWKASDTRPLAFADCRVPRATCSGPRGEGLTSSSRSSTAAASRSPRWARPGAGRATSSRSPTRATRQPVRPPDRPVPGRSSSSSPTWPPRSPPARALVYRAAWLKDRGPPVRARRRRWPSSTPASSRAGWRTRRVQIHGGYGYMDEFADLAVLPRRQDPRDRRGHERDPAPRDRTWIGAGRMIFEQIVWRDLGCASLPRGLPGRGRGRRRRSAAGRARGARAVQAQRRPPGGRDRDPYARRSRLGARRPGPRPGVLDRDPRGRERRLRAPAPARRRRIEVGNIALDVFHTPGHRPEHCCIVVSDRTRGDEPWLVLSGDALFVGDSGRPDLAVAGDEGAAALYRSLHERLGASTTAWSFPGSRRGLALRARHVGQALVHARLRAALQPDARRDDRRPVREARRRKPVRRTADHGAHRRAQPRPAADRGPAERAHGLAPGGRARCSTCAVARFFAGGHMAG